MPQSFTITLDKPLKSAAIATDGAELLPAGMLQGASPPGEADSGSNTSAHAIQVHQNALIKDLESQKAHLEHLCCTLENVLAEIKRFHEQTISQQPQHVAKLSVEIARKVLMQKIREKDYETETILAEALKNAPAHTSIVVRLNPDDLGQCRKLQEDRPQGDIADIKFVADPNIGPAQCVLETPKGIVKSLIDEHLARIEEALAKVK